MTRTRAIRASVPSWTGGAVVATLLGLIVLLGAWFLVLDGGRGRPVTVNDHTDNAVPTVDREAPRLPAIA